MISKWQWLLAQLTRTLWIRATLYVVLALAAALLAVLIERLLPGPLPIDIGADAVDRILDILASSMLAVTTFSLSVMVAAYSTATTNVTPRATRLPRTPCLPTPRDQMFPVILAGDDGIEPRLKRDIGDTIIPASARGSIGQPTVVP